MIYVCGTQTFKNKNPNQNIGIFNISVHAAAEDSDFEEDLCPDSPERKKGYLFFKIEPKLMHYVH